MRDYVGGGGTGWQEKHWAVVNRPIFVPGDSEVKYLLHEVTDISVAVRLSRRLKHEAIVAAEQADSLRQMLDEQLHREQRLREAGGHVERLLRATSGVTGDDVMRYVDELAAALGWPLPLGEYVRPGEIAPMTGVYECFHLRGCHTLNPHQLLRAEMPVPACPTCGNAVLFRVPPNPHRIK